MVTLGRTDGAVGRVALGGIAASLVIGLAACGSAVAGAGGAAKPASPARGRAVAKPAVSQLNPGGLMVPASAAKHAALCADIPQLTRLTFTRTFPVPSHLRETLPLGFTIRDAATVRRLATLLCALPPVPPGVMSCPNLIGGSYRLFFAAPGRRPIPSLALQLSGCRVVTGLGPVRSWATSPRLAQALTQEFGSHFRLNGLQPPAG